MKNAIEYFKEKFSEFYEIVNTFEVVNKEGKIIRIEIVKNYNQSKEIGIFSVNYYQEYRMEVINDSGIKMTKFIWGDAEYPSVNMQTEELALRQALSFILHPE